MRGDAGEHGKDAELCLHCGGPRPPSLGTKPRKFCSQRCCHEATRLRNRPPKPRPAACRFCGCSLPPPVRAAGRSRATCDACRRLRWRGRPIACVCQGCGKSFHSLGRGKSFCSAACRGKMKQADCPCCGQRFTKKTRRQTYCSVKCSSRHVKRKPPKQRVCLCCGIQFTRTRRPSGSYTAQKKYCSRECAFWARRLRLPCAARPLLVASQLASWFHSWGDDVYPIVSKCQKCGVPTSRTRESSLPASICGKCAKPPRCCICKLPHVVADGRRACEKCRLDARRRKIEAGKRTKKKYGRNHRQRCRYYGAPYTPIRLVDIYERDNWTCQICGVALNRKWDKGDPTSRTIDHIIPLSLGPGSPGHIPSNVRAACHRCNSVKSNSVAPLEPSTLH